MRVVVFGAGAIGGVIGGGLHEAGHEVTLIARGAHRDAIARDGLVVEHPDRRVTLRLPVVGDPAGLGWEEPAVVVLAVKSQDTEAALAALEAVAPPDTPVVCAQNGVENERRALRRFPHTYAMCVMCPATHLDPGVVHAHSSPVTGLLDLGRYPGGVDPTAEAVARALSGAGFDARPVADIMRWKYAKLLMNLLNAVEALCSPGARGGELAAAVRREGVACLDAAGIAYASEEEDAERRGSSIRLAATNGRAWSGGSSWQSLARGTGTVEADFLNGEIALLGRLHGVPTPLNSLLARLANESARSGAPPGQWSPERITELAREPRDPAGV